MAIDFNAQASDHVHEIHYDNDAGQFEPVGHFDYDEIDRRLGFEPDEPDSTVTMSDAAAAWSLLLSFICGRADTAHSRLSLTSSGARAQLILYWLDSANSRYDSIDAIASEANMTRQALSKALADLRQELGGILPLKRSYSSDVYRRAQEASIKAGVHSKFNRKDAKQSRTSQKLAG
jgi:hypothetical protein